jgi:hypothetical protein
VNPLFRFPLGERVAADKTADVTKRTQPSRPFPREANTPIGGPLIPQSAFSLIEIMVTVGLLSLIILGLVAMFSQTQRAFKTSMSQADVLESGRAVAEMLSRELSEITPSYVPFTTNMMVIVDTNHLQDLPGTSIKRTNTLDKFFFLTKYNMDWTGIGYEVLPTSPGAAVGTLYRYSANARRFDARLLSSNFLYVARNGFVTNRVVDGVVHFKITPFAKNGYPLFREFGYTNALYSTNQNRPFYFATLTNSDVAPSYYFPDQLSYNFFSNTVPAFVELELGVLEKQTLDRYRALPTNDVSQLESFLATRAAQVQIFRQRIPIRNVDLSVYQ